MSSTRFMRIAFVTLLALSLLGARRLPAGHVLVCISRDEPGGMSRDVRPFGIEVRGFGGAKGFAGLSAALDDARFLFLHPQSGSAFAKAIRMPASRRAIKGLLARGGVIWFGDGYDYGRADVQASMKSLGAPMPGKPEGEVRRTVAANARSDHPLLSWPIPQTRRARSYKRWKTWPKGLQALMIEDKNPGGAAGLLIADGVQGKGTVIYSRVQNGWSVRQTKIDAIVKNTLVRAYGKDILGRRKGWLGALLAAGVPGAKYEDPYALRTPPANTARLANAAGALWHVADASDRKAFLISESVGLARQPAYVEIRWPGRDHSQQVRAFAIDGVELHAQALGSGRIAVSVPLREYDDRVIYVYLGGTSRPDARDTSLLAVANRREGWYLRNNRFEAVMAPESPVLFRINPYGGLTNLLVTWGHSERWMGYGTNFFGVKAPGKTSKAELVADGPVLKRIRYTIRDGKGTRQVEISLIRGARALFYRLTADRAVSVSTETGWAPGGSLIDDTLWYETPGGIKRVAVNTGRDLGAKAKETWYAILDEAAGEVAGGFVERDADGGFSASVFSHFVHGHCFEHSAKFTPGGSGGGWVAGRGGPGPVRDAYIAWRCPPVVTAGAAQGRADVPAPRTPRLGEQFLRMHGSFRRYNPITVSTGVDRWSDNAITAVIEAAGNVVSMGNVMQMQHYAPLVAGARTRGLASCLAPNFRNLTSSRRGGKACTLSDRAKYMDIARGQAELKADMYYLFDEFAHACACDICRADFTKKTGLTMPAGRVKHTALPDRATYQSILWQMNTMTDIVRQMDALVKSHRPDALTFCVTNAAAGGWELPSYNDLETWSQFIGVTATDFYHGPPRDRDYYQQIRFGLQFIRGAQGNAKPSFSVCGNGFARGNYVNLGAHLMNGANGLWFFHVNLRRSQRQDIEPVIREFALIRDTPLSELLARTRMVRYAAVLCERNSFFEDIRRGHLRHRRPWYHYYLEKQAALRNVPMDIVFTCHLAKELSGYKVLIVPSGVKMSDASAATIAGWVRSGGKVIVEGEALRTAAMAKLCGVATAGPPAGGKVGLTLKGARSHSPGITVHTLGQGRAYAIARVNPSESIVRPLVLRLGGPLPIDVDADSAPHTFVAAATDGTRTVIGVLNETPGIDRKITIRLGDLPPAGPRVATNLHRGTRQAAGDRLTVQVPGETWNLIVLEPAGSAHVLRKPSGAVDSPAHASRSGMTFLKPGKAQ